MNKSELYLHFNGQTTEQLEATLAQYNKDIARMVHLNDLNGLLDGKEVIEAILKERANGAK